MGGSTDEWVAGIASYVRTSFGNSGGLVTPADVARVRGETAARKTLWTIPELEASLPRLLDSQQFKLRRATHRDAAAGAATLRGWNSGVPQTAGMWFTVELPQPVMLTEIQFDSTGAGGGGGGRAGRGAPPAAAAGAGAPPATPAGAAPAVTPSGAAPAVTPGAAAPPAAGGTPAGAPAPRVRPRRAARQRQVDEVVARLRSGIRVPIRYRSRPMARRGASQSSRAKATARGRPSRSHPHGQRWCASRRPTRPRTLPTGRSAICASTPRRKVERRNRRAERVSPLGLTNTRARAPAGTPPTGALVFYPAGAQRQSRIDGISCPCCRM